MGLWGYRKQQTGDIIIGTKYDEVGDFREGISPIRIGYPWGFIDLKREIIIKPKFNNVGDFSDGYVWVENSSGLLLLDKKEKAFFPNLQ